MKFYYQQLYFKTIPVDSGFVNKQMISLKVFEVVFDKFLVYLSLKNILGGDIFGECIYQKKTDALTLTYFSICFGINIS